MPDTTDEMAVAICKGTAEARDILEPKPLGMDYEIHHLVLSFLVGRSPEAQLPPDDPLKWSLVVSNLFLYEWQLAYNLHVYINKWEALE